MTIPKLYSTTASLILLCLSASPARCAVSFTNVFTFNYTNGANPSGGLIVGSDGDLYGTTRIGADSHQPPCGAAGIVFRLRMSGGFDILAVFHCTDGLQPSTSLVQTSDGSLFGTTIFGGPANWGTIYRVTTNGQFTSLASLNGTNGVNLYVPLVLADDGMFYGAADRGGDGYNGTQSSGFGTLFRMELDGRLTRLISLGYTNGAIPTGLMKGTDGVLYGTTQLGGSRDLGTVFSLTTNGTLITLLSFNGTNGSEPCGPLIQGADGSLYGATEFGGSRFTSSRGSGNGTIFRISTNGTLTTLFSFNGTNGSVPSGPISLASDGRIYGTTYAGGAVSDGSTWAGNGTVFRLSPNGGLESLWEFADGERVSASAGLTPVGHDSFYGVLNTGGASGYGTIFRIQIEPEPPILQISMLTNKAISLSWSSISGRTYQVQFQTNLGDTSWFSLGGQVIASNSMTQATDDSPSPTNRFYRVVLTQ